MPAPTRVLFVCLGNICRSPMADGLLRHLVAQRGLAEAFVVDSAGTGAYHVGETADPRTLSVLHRHGIQYDGRARRVEERDFTDFDLILAMDHANLANLRRRCPPAQQHKLHLTLEPLGGGEVPDPYYGGPTGFDDNYRLLERALDAWLDRLT